MIKIKHIEEKLTPAKKTIEVKDVYVEHLRFVDETGDVTKEVLEALPEGVDTVSFKITVELPVEESTEDED